MFSASLLSFSRLRFIFFMYSGTIWVTGCTVCFHLCLLFDTRSIFLAKDLIFCNLPLYILLMSLFSVFFSHYNSITFSGFMLVCWFPLMFFVSCFFVWCFFSPSPELIWAFSCFFVFLLIVAWLWPRLSTFIMFLLRTVFLSPSIHPIIFYFGNVVGQTEFVSSHYPRYTPYAVPIFARHGNFSSRGECSLDGGFCLFFFFFSVILNYTLLTPRFCCFACVTNKLCYYFQ